MNGYMVLGGKDTFGRRKRGLLLARGMAEGAKPSFDIIERTFEFGVMVVELVRRLPASVAERHLAYQLIKSGTSIGANV